MSQARQALRAQEPGILGRSLSLRLPERQRISQHAHHWVQIVYVSRGALAVEAEGKRWPVPPQRCLWVPAGVEHAVETARPASMQTIYLPPDVAPSGPTQPRLFETTPFTRQLILKTVRIGALHSTDRSHASMAALLAEMVPRVQAIGLELPLPTDARALRLARFILDAPGDTRPVTAFKHMAGASTRTLERLFLTETEMSIGRWRQHARLQHAVRLLAEGSSVSSVALDCGYESLSAFVAAFRRTLGVTPGKFLTARQLQTPNGEELDGDQGRH
jgi:AraC-like DNA-binding protein